ncbi:unnamed protein product [Blepharisma stoltei]|uniref:SAC domain-containing protein n=1 Tax=Blepharisma stoltei TaxID=1481888 RepID=A0AAU9J6F9_9CILI|nr:unnamed protein product [Blepharisma stoltei]
MESYRNIKIYDAGTYFLITGQKKTSPLYSMIKIIKSSGPISIQEDFQTLSQNDLLMYLSNILPKDNIRTATEAEAILGLTKFLQGYYLYYITKSQKVAKIRDQSIYKIQETKLLKLFPEKQKSEEKRYMDIFSGLDMAMGFYYSYTYDLTHTLQENISSMMGDDKSLSRSNKRTQSQHHLGECVNNECEHEWEYYPWKTMYVWNHDQMISVLSALKDKTWITPIIHGYVGYHCLSMVGRILDLVVIARRSRYFAGTRYLKRGLNEEGKVANDVEEEQILIDKGPFGPMSSFVQVRGSVPLFWCQEPNPVIPPPAIILNKNDFLREGTRKHIADLFQRYGKPLNLISLLRYQKKHKENAIAQEYFRCVEYLNGHLPDKYKLKFYPFDIKTEEKTSRANMINKMYILAGECLDQTSIFTCKFKTNGLMKCAFQIGTVRTNCIDSIDRTNIAQMLVARVALERQLKEMGLAQYLNIDSMIIRLISQLYEEMGDMIGIQYSGSEAHKGKYIQNKKKKKKFTAIKRHWANLITDPKKQQAMNLFLGVYKPLLNNVPLWEIEDDTRLHNPIDLNKKNPEKDWWKIEVGRFLKRLGIWSSAAKEEFNRSFPIRRVFSETSLSFGSSPKNAPVKKRTRTYSVSKGLFTLPKSSKMSYFDEKMPHPHCKIVEIPFYDPITYEFSGTEKIEEKSLELEKPSYLKLKSDELAVFENSLKNENKNDESFSEKEAEQEDFCVDPKELVKEAGTDLDLYFNIKLDGEFMLEQEETEDNDKSEVSVILENEDASHKVHILENYVDSKPSTYAKIL